MWIRKSIKRCIYADGYDCDGFNKNKSKRIRTTFTEEQLQVLQANFSIDSNPDGQDLERIANMTALSKRVTQVWFQNCRARQKKHKSPRDSDRSPIQTLLPIVPPDICMQSITAAAWNEAQRFLKWTSSKTIRLILRWFLWHSSKFKCFEIKLLRITMFVRLCTCTQINDSFWIFIWWLQQIFPRTVFFKRSAKTRVSY